MFAVFTAVATWLKTSIVDLIDILYTAESGLTILGVLAVAALGFSVVFLIMGIIQGFFHFRG